MSHFTVLVVAGSEEELEEKLLPFHEYECTGIEAYLEFVPADMKEHEGYWKEYAAEKALEEYMEDAGFKRNEEGVWGRMTNPRARWDWWVVGGRWSRQVLRTKMGHEVDRAVVGDLDIERMKAEKMEAYRKRWRVWAARPVEGEIGHYFMDNGMWDVDREEEEKLVLGEEEYVKWAFGIKGGLTWAYVDEGGKWVEGSEMGWFGQSRGERDDVYARRQWEWLESLPSDAVVWLVDCHI